MTERCEYCGSKLIYFWQDMEWDCDHCGHAPSVQLEPPQRSDYSTKEEPAEEEKPLPGSTADYLDENDVH